MTRMSTARSPCLMLSPISFVRCVVVGGYGRGVPAEIRPPVAPSSRRVELTHPAVHLGLGILLGPAVSLLQLADELIPLSGDDVEVVVGELAPPLLHLAAHLLPLAFQDVGVHPQPSCVKFGARSFGTRANRRASAYDRGSKSAAQAE